MQSEWEEIKLSEITIRITKGTTPSKKDGGFSETGINYIKAESVGFDGRIDSSKFSFISNDVHNKLKRSQLQSQDILFSMAGVHLGKSGIVEEEHLPANTNQALSLIRPNQDLIFPKYLHYFLQQRSVVKFVNNSTSQSAQPNINLAEIGNLVIRFPELSIQKKITRILSTLDDKIELNRKMNQTLEEMAQALFKSWFVDFDPVHAKAGAKSNAELEKAAAELGISKEMLELFPREFEESEMGMIPKGWEVKSLSDVVNFQNGYSFKSKELHHDTNNSTKVFKMGHIHRGGGFKEEGKDTYFYNVDSNKMDKYLLKKGDILMAMTDMKANMALLAHTALMPHTNKYLLNQRAGRLRIKDTEILDYPYVYIFSNYPDTIHDLRSRSNSGVQVNLTTKAILDTEIIVPEQKIHAEFNKATLALYEKIFSNNAEIVSLQKTRDTLLPKLLSGELDVSEVQV